MQRDRKMWPTIKEKRQSIENNPKMTGRLELADKDFKAAILSISEDLKEKFVQITTTDKVYQQRNKKYFKNQKEILQSK